MINQAHSIVNQLFFSIRKSLHWSRQNLDLPAEDKSPLLQTQEQIQEEMRLVESYKLSNFKDFSTRQTYQENLFNLKLLERALENIPYDWAIETLKVLDVGSKNFSTATALHHFFCYYRSNKGRQRHISLDGIEIDAYRIMSNLHSRADYAHYYIQNLSNTRYLVGDLFTYPLTEYNVITWFLPFLTPKPLLKWGLPLKHFRPRTMLKHAYEKLTKQGIMIIANQTNEEMTILIRLLDDLSIPYSSSIKDYSNVFSPFTCNRYITTIIKK